VDVAPRAHILRRVAKAVGAKRAGVGAREVGLEHRGVEVADVLAALAGGVVPDARALEDVHEFLGGTPVERERAVSRQLEGGPGGVALALALTLMILILILAMNLALALALALVLVLVGVSWIRMRRMRRRMRHG